VVVPTLANFRSKVPLNVLDVAMSVCETTATNNVGPDTKWIRLIRIGRRPFEDVAYHIICTIVGTAAGTTHGDHVPIDRSIPTGAVIKVDYLGARVSYVTVRVCDCKLWQIIGSCTIKSPLVSSISNSPWLVKGSFVPFVFVGDEELGTRVAGSNGFEADERVGAILSGRRVLRTNRLTVV